MNVYAVLGAVLTAGVGALIVALLNGTVPLPAGWEWAVPIVVAMLLAAIGGGTLATPQLKLGPPASGREH